MVEGAQVMEGESWRVGELESWKVGKLESWRVEKKKEVEEVGVEKDKSQIPNTKSQTDLKAKCEEDRSFGNRPQPFAAFIQNSKLFIRNYLWPF